MKTRARKDSVNQKSSAYAGGVEIPVPVEVVFTDSEKMLWSSFTRARGADHWRDMDLILLVKVVKNESRIRAAQDALDAQGIIIENQRGTQIMNPLMTAIDTLQRQQLALIRSMSLTQMPVDARTANGAGAKSKAAAEKLERHDDGLIPRLLATNENSKPH